MVNKWTFYLTKKGERGGLCCVLMLSASLKENASIWGLHRLIYSFFLTMTGHNSVMCFLASSFHPEYGVSMRQYLPAALLASVSSQVWGLHYASGAGRSSNLCSWQNLHHMQSLLLLLHLNLALQEVKSCCFPRTDFSVHDDFLTQHLMSTIKTGSRKMGGKITTNMN